MHIYKVAEMHAAAGSVSRLTSNVQPERLSKRVAFGGIIIASVAMWFLVFGLTRIIVG